MGKEIDPLMEKGRFKEANTHFQKLLKIHDSHSTNFINFGGVTGGKIKNFSEQTNHSEKELWDQVIQNYRKGISIQSTSSEDWTRHVESDLWCNFGSDIQNILTKESSRDYNFSVDINMMYFQSLQINPAFADCLHNLGFNYKIRQNRYKLAKIFYGKALKANPNHKNAQIGLKDCQEKISIHSSPLVCFV